MAGKKVSPYAPEQTQYEKKLNIKQKKYIKGVTEGKRKKDAAIDAGYSPNTAKNPLRNIEQSIVADHGKTIQQLLDEHLPIEEILNTVKDGMKAEKVTRAQAFGEFTDEVTDPDHTTRLKSAEIASKLRGMFVDKVEVATTEKHILILPDNHRQSLTDASKP